MFTELLEKLQVEINNTGSEREQKLLRYNELVDHFDTVGYDTPTEFDEEYEELENHLSTLETRNERLMHAFEIIQNCQRADNVLEIAHILTDDYFNEWI